MCETDVYTKLEAGLESAIRSFEQQAIEYLGPGFDNEYIRYQCIVEFNKLSNYDALQLVINNII